MWSSQKVLVVLVLLFASVGLLFALWDYGLPTGAAVARGVPPEYQKSTGLFCYRSLFCQSGIECIYLDQHKPFCTQPAAFDRNLGQKFGEPCYVSVEGQINCPFVRPQEAVLATSFSEGEKGMMPTSRGYVG